MTSKRYPNIASASDIHLGHPNTSTKQVLHSLRRAFPDNEETGKLDVICFAGDLFDRALQFSDPNAVEIKIWMNQFLRMCKRRDIMVWVLEGTPSHDWAQSKWFKVANEQGKIDCDLHYVDTLSIEYFEKFGINVLFIPDEWSPSGDETWMQVQQLLQGKGLEKVDYAVMHGSFDYQLPPVARSQSMHMPDRYLSIVEKYIFIGHIHIHSVYDRILAHGSLDRLTHGEEETKGHWRVWSGPNGDEIVFVENKHAKIYKTIDCGGLAIEDALQRIDDTVKHYPEDSAIRIQAVKGDAVLTNLDVLRKKYPHLSWTTKSVDQASVQTNLLVDMRSTFTQVAITRQNITGLLMERVRGMCADPRVISRCQQRLEELTQ